MHVNISPNSDNFIFKTCIWKCLLLEPKELFSKNTHRLHFIIFICQWAVLLKKPAPSLPCSSALSCWHSQSCCRFLEQPSWLCAAASCITFCCFHMGKGTAEMSDQGGSSLRSSALYELLWIVILKCCQVLVSSKEEHAQWERCFDLLLPAVLMVVQSHREGQCYLLALIWSLIIKQWPAFHLQQSFLWVVWLLDIEGFGVRLSSVLIVTAFSICCNIVCVV